MNFIEAIKKSITEIRDDYHKRIYGYSGDELFIIPKNVTQGHWGAENEEPSIKCVVMHNNFTQLDYYGFAYTFEKLEKVIFSENLQSIGLEAFANCWLIHEVKLPATVENIDSYAFMGCSGLCRFDLTEYANGAPFPNLGEGVFELHGAFRIIVPHGRLQELASMTNWSEYAEYMVSDITTEDIPNPELLATKDYVDDANPVKNGVLTLGGTTLNEEQLAQILTISDVENNSLVDLIYPVGSIYITAEDRRPAELFGGTWEQIQGRFLLGTGPNEENTDTTWGQIYAGEMDRPLGEMGGARDVQLTVDHIPNHSHRLGGTYSRISETSESNGGDRFVTTDYKGLDNGLQWVVGTGGGGWHNNMPPYLAVNIWKRMA